MQNPTQSHGRSSIVYDELKLPYSSIVFAETSHTFPTYQCLQKDVWEFFYFVQILSYLEKLERPGFYTFGFYIFINNSRSRQNKKNLEHPFLDIIRQKTCAKFQQKILNSLVVRGHQSFQIFRQKTWFLGNNRPLP